MYGRLSTPKETIKEKVWEVFTLKLNENGYYDMFYKEEFDNIYIDIEDAIEWAVSFYSHYGIVTVVVEPIIE